MAPIDNPKTAQTRPTQKAGDKVMRPIPPISERPKTSGAEAANWIAASGAMARPEAVRFCQTVPSVIESVLATETRSAAVGMPPAPPRRGANTSAIPTVPKTTPIQRRPDTRSPRSGHAKMAVAIGCAPAIRAESAAGMPCETAQNTPPR